MAVERQWFYEGTAPTGDADGNTCIFCGQPIVDESQPGRWVLKAVEDNPDVDFPVESGYAHYTCTRERLEQQPRRRFQLPEVPKGPRG